MNNKNQLYNMLGKFVTAKLKDDISPQQGWIVEINPLIIKGTSGQKYECEGYPVIVQNSPNQLFH